MLRQFVYTEYNPANWNGNKPQKEKRNTHTMDEHRNEHIQLQNSPVLANARQLGRIS